MSNLQIVLLILVSSAVSVTGMLILAPILNKKGINVEEEFQNTDKILNGIDKVVDVAKMIVPNSPIVNIIDKVQEYAYQGVHAVEQLYISSKLTADERNAAAKDSVHNVLNLLGVEITPEIEKVIDNCIEAEVLALGHKEEASKIVQANLEVANQQLQTKINEQLQINQTLQSENRLLKDKVTQMQNVVGNIR
ncbi:hypothetical protein [Clostridium sp. YIM B02551]|uniref:hypothetical protein n=1 Tax=Clostridium sp. YIM B02551 TaxID=2910679 RepID=UPI001EEA0744|nr:hypothetical protein [Clostridium sp. YIM B02551]